MNKLWVRWTLGLALLAGTAAAPLHSQGIFKLSEEEELAIGEQAAKEIEQQEPILRDSRVESYVNRLGQELVRSSGRSDIPYYFKVVDAAEVNAFALPGGYIYINRGLIGTADNESEVAGVLAHEIGHVVGRHSAEQIRKLQLTGLGLGILGAILGDRGTGGQIAQISSQLVATGLFLKFSREAEREADRLGAQNMFDAGYDPRGMVTLFEKLASMRQSQPNAVDKFFSSHPAPEERAENVDDLIRSFPYRRDLRQNSREFADIQRYLGQLPPPVRGTSDDPNERVSTPDPGTPQPARTYRGQREDLELAARYAPEFLVGLSDDPRRDLPTRLDFDGDWDTSDNLAAAEDRSYRAPAYVYYGVAETETHHYLTYSLYFPYRQTADSRASSSNDVQTVLVVLEKGDRNDDAGRVALVEVLSEEGVRRYLPGASLLGGFGSFALDGERVQLWVDPEGHRVEAYTGESGQQTRARRGVLRYQYAGRAEEPANVRGDRIGFDLLPLFELWDRARTQPGSTFGEVYNFGAVEIEVADSRGRRGRRSVEVRNVGTALSGEQRFSRAGVLPWGYRGTSSSNGAWFFDPASRVKEQFDLGDAFSTTYLHHPFLEVVR